MNYFTVTTVVGSCDECPHRGSDVDHRGLHCKLVENDGPRARRVLLENKVKLTDTCPMWPEVDHLSDEFQPMVST